MKSLFLFLVVTTLIVIAPSKSFGSSYKYVEANTPIAMTAGGGVEMMSKAPQSRPMVLRMMDADLREKFVTLMRSGKYEFIPGRSLKETVNVTELTYFPDEDGVVRRQKAKKNYQYDYVFYKDAALRDRKTGESIPLNDLIKKWKRQKQLETGRYGLHLFQKMLDIKNRVGVYSWKQDKKVSTSEEKPLNTDRRFVDNTGNAANGMTPRPAPAGIALMP
ncbi:MAG TPA: hypothetical protein VJB59_12360 [Bdellovibrionota bacterium]|nr:hypothetical protein [Bdellovibrionota bacterium]